MAEIPGRKPPLPLVQSFLTCQQIFQDQRTQTNLLLSPVAQVPVSEFPALVRLSIHTEFTGGHGSYLPSLCLRDATGEVVWEWTANVPFAHDRPLWFANVIFNDLMLAVPQPGRYSLVLFLNEDEAAQRMMWFETGPDPGMRPGG